MESEMGLLIIIAVVVLLPLIYVIATYNTLVALRNHIAEAWSNIDTELKRRYDLIPNLVETVKGYAKHERETMEKVIELRNLCAADRGSVSHQEGTERQLVGAVQKLLAVAEAYPDLKANQNFLELQHELVNTEDRIQAARRFYNGNVRDMRNQCERFPSSIVASLFSFQPQDFFDVEPAVREAPSVEGAFS
jgi:LemA protein